MKITKAGRLAVLLTLCNLPQTARLAAELAPPIEQPHEMRLGAELADVFFLDAERGWAVGDRGVIWHTDNAGTHWRMQPSGVGCRLESICFIDANHGWAVGGWSSPYTHTSHGVLLRTTDGGVTWSRERKSNLPRLTQIKMFGQRGWAIGQSSVHEGPARYPSGVFQTLDAGRSWKSVATSGHGGWLAGAFRDPTAATLIGPEGQMAMIRGGQFTAHRKLDTLLHSGRAVALAKAERVYFAGDGGLLAVSTNGGRNWKNIEASLPRGLGRNFDFKTIATRGDDVWLAGSPGTIVLHSSNAGRSWSVGRTGQQVPINDLAFVDRHRGWAVGALGNILVTRDAGRSWRRQRGGGSRVGLMAVFSRPADLPLELLVRLAGNDAHRAVAEIINSLDSSVPEAAGVNDNTAWLARSRQALATAGASGVHIAWQFPLRRSAALSTARELAAGWDPVELQKHLVRRIRMWRPEVIVTHSPHPAGDQAAAHMINQAVLRAAGEAATDRDLGTLGQQPWQVTKVFTALGPGHSGTIDVITSKLASRLATTLGERAGRARGFLTDRPQPRVEKFGFRLVLNRSKESDAAKDFFDKRRPSGGDPGRRAVGPFRGAGLAMLNRVAAARREVRSALSHSQSAEAGPEAIRDVLRLTQGIERHTTCEILLRLADGYHRRGRWDLAAISYETITRQFADQPSAEYALQWLIRYTASGEADHRAEFQRAGSADRFPVRRASAERPSGGNPVTGHPVPESDVKRAGGRSTLDSDKPDARGKRASDRGPKPILAGRLASAIERTRPLLAAEPSIRLPLAAAFLKSDQTDRAEQLIQALSASNRRGIWRQSARNQQWKLGIRDMPAGPILFCEKAATKPFLDGRLDDAVWHDREPMRLRSRRLKQRSPGAANFSGVISPAEVRLAYDDEFLYVAVRCPKAGGFKYLPPAAGAIRPRDADLTAHDRVELLIDIDCDHATYYRLAVDHRGWTADSAWGDHTWNPKWFVASRSDAKQWTAELAIPLSSLTSGEPETWAVGVQRQIPGAGFQSWTPYASPRGLPQGFGLVRFNGPAIRNNRKRDTSVRDSKNNSVTAFIPH